MLRGRSRVRGGEARIIFVVVANFFMRAIEGFGLLPPRTRHLLDSPSQRPVPAPLSPGPGMHLSPWAKRDYPFRPYRAAGSLGKER